MLREIDLNRWRKGNYFQPNYILDNGIRLDIKITSSGKLGLYKKLVRKDPVLILGDCNFTKIIERIKLEFKEQIKEKG